jgi:PGF-CTERM protein
VNERALSVALTFLLVVSALSTAGAGMVSASHAANADDATTFHVTQGGECYDVEPIGDGSQSVEDFYDYRSNETHPNETEWRNWTYSSWGTTHLQENQGSKLFVYNGSDGYSLVVLHDKFALDGGDGSNATTVTFTMSGMANVSWAVKDDTYGNDTQDDNWDTDGSVHEIDWMWANNRTDGGAVGDIQGESITIDPAFNEDASEWGQWPYSGDENNRTESWDLIYGDETEESLNRDQSVTVEAGSCPDETGPNADLTANPNTVGNDESVTLDASGSSDDEGIDRYEWDFDGDGNVDDTTTDTATVENTYESTGDYTASVTVVDGNGNEDTATAEVTVTSSDSNITFINATAVEVEGSYDTVRLNVGFYDETGYGNVKPGATNVSGTTVIEVEDYGVNGSVINTVELYEDESDAYSNPAEERKHPRLDHYAETIKPYPVNVSVEEVTETSDGTYEVTFGYDNPNDESLDMRDSTLSGNVSGEAPEVVEPGNNTFTVTWTPDSDMERATWTLDRTNFGQEEVSASTQPAGEYGDDTGATEADVTATPTEGFGETEFTFDASNSTGDEGIEEFRWDLDGDGEVDRTTETAEITHTYSEAGDHEVTVQVVDATGATDVATTTVTIFEVSDDEPPTARLSVPSGSMSQLLYPFNATDSTDDDEIVEYRWDVDGDGKIDWVESEDGITSIKPYEYFDEPGTYEASVTVVDSAGQTDTATAEFKLKKVPPEATIHASSETVEVGEEVTFTAKKFTEDPDTLKHICWKVGDEPGPDGKTWTTSFDEAGEKQIKLVLRDRAGYETVEKQTITVTAADGGNGGDNGGDENNNNKGGSNNPNRGGSQPPANDGDDGKDDEPVKAPLNGEHAEMGEIALLPAADADATLEVSETAPADVEAPSVADDGFEALSYVTVADAEQATFTVSKDSLDAAGATADDVTLFRYEDGAWTAVETEQVNETDDAVEFAANTTDATYAVGVERPATGVTDLSVESQRVEPGETVTVVATVENTGLADGTHEVQLTVGGDVVATQTVEVAAGATEQVSLTHAFDESGTFDVSVEGEQAEVVVEGVETQTTDDSGEAETSTSTTTNDGAGVPGFGVGVALVALLGAALLALRRR